MGTVRKTIQNLKPGKDYLLAVRSVNTDLGVASDPTDFIRFTVPQDNTIPSVPENLSLVASFLNVMFVFNNVTDLDILHYEYELYKIAQITEVNQEYQILSGELPYRSGINSANVFVVSVDENSTTSSTSSVDSPVAFYGRVRSVDTSGNVSDWTQIAKSGDTPLIDEEFIGSLTAAKITAGTISSAEITLSGSNSIIQSSTYKDPLNPGQNGWYINGNGEFSLGGPDGINYNGSAITIGSDVQVTANFSADSITVGTGLSSTLEINDAINNGGGGMTLGNPLYNYWYANGRFSVGDADHTMVWNGSDLLVNGTSITGGSVGGISVGLDKIFIGTGDFNNSNTAFYADNLGRFSLKDKLSWDGTTLVVKGDITGSSGTFSGTLSTSSFFLKDGASNTTELYNDSTQVYNEDPLFYTEPPPGGIVQLEVGQADPYKSSYLRMNHGSTSYSNSFIGWTRYVDSSTPIAVRIQGPKTSSADSWPFVELQDGETLIGSGRQSNTESMLSATRNGIYITHDGPNYVSSVNIVNGSISLNGSTSVNGLMSIQPNSTGSTYGSGISSSPPRYIGQSAGSNDGWRIYGESPASNNGKMVLEVIDDMTESFIFRHKKTYGDYAAVDHELTTSGFYTNGLFISSSNVKDLFYGGSGNNAGKRIFIQSSQPTGSNGDIWIKP